MRAYQVSFFGLLFIAVTLGWVIPPETASQAMINTVGIGKDVQILRDVPYGAHERNVLDLWIVNSEKPAPIVLYIHGGGFRQGDKKSIREADLNAYLDAGFSVAAINYRLTNTAPAPAAYLDCARALQFLRHHARKWNIDVQRIASTGGSAGAGISMWLAFHDDMANATSSDPVARESTRLTCIAVNNGQPSYDPRFAEKAGIPRPNFERHVFFLPFYDITSEQTDTPLAYQRYTEAAPVTYISPDDPPVLLDYSYTNEVVDENTSLDHIVHHPKLGIALKERLDSLNIYCIVQYPDIDGKIVRYNSRTNEPVISKIEFIKKYLTSLHTENKNK